MKISQNTILITGGGSGIGFETAKLLAEFGNTVILTGRNEEKLKRASQQIENSHYIVADITKEYDVKMLVRRINVDFPNLNMLVNNAGLAFLHKLIDSPDAELYARAEMETNYFGPINLTTQLLPLLKKQPEAAIINVSSIVAFAPGLSLPTYSASKAALHSYTQALRLSLAEKTNIKVFEVMPPLVDTEFAKDIPSDKKISPRKVAEELIYGLESNNFEVRVASTEHLYTNFLSKADQAVLALNGLDLN